MDAIRAILRPYLEGQPAVFVNGRSLYDLVLDEGGAIRPLIETLRRVCREDHGMAVITYSLAGGLDWGSSRIKDERDRRVIEQVAGTSRRSRADLPIRGCTSAGFSAALPTS